MKEWALFPRAGARQGGSLLPLLLTIVLEVIASVIKQEKEMKGTNIGQGGVKTSLFVDNMICM